MEAMEVLKKMIKSWLDENYPAMPNPERQRLANAMDVSLVEETKENSMKSLGFNTFEVVRMSFIEMQWLKKVSLSRHKLVCVVVSLRLDDSKYM